MTPLPGTTFDAFPFQPYHIQLELMRHIYRTLECGGVGVFESPTGTVNTALAVLRPHSAAV